MDRGGPCGAQVDRGCSKRWLHRRSSNGEQEAAEHCQASYGGTKRRSLWQVGSVLPPASISWDPRSSAGPAERAVIPLLDAPAARTGCVAKPTVLTGAFGPLHSICG